MAELTPEEILKELISNISDLKVIPDGEKFSPALYRKAKQEHIEDALAKLHQAQLAKREVCPECNIVSGVRGAINLLFIRKYSATMRKLAEILEASPCFGTGKGRPDREKLKADIIVKMGLVTAIGTSSASLDYVADQIIALSNPVSKEREE